MREILVLLLLAIFVLPIEAAGTSLRTSRAVVKNQKITVVAMDSENNTCGNRMGGFDAIYQGEKISVFFTIGKIQSNLDLCPSGGKLSFLNRSINVFGNWEGINGFNAIKIVLQQNKSPKSESMTFGDKNEGATRGHEAIVNNMDATFSIPISPNKEWVWFKEPGLEYEWQVRITHAGKEIEFGFMLINDLRDLPPIKKGPIQNLLADGQFSVWEVKGKDAKVLEGHTVKGFLSSNGNRLILQLLGEKTIDLLFSNKPTHCIFKNKLTGGKISLTQVPMTYQSPNKSKKISPI